MQAIILAAGMGKRLGELTQNNTKCMVEVNGEPLIDRLLRQICNYSLSKVVIVVGYEGDKLISHLGNQYNGVPIVYVTNPVFDKTNNIYSLFLAKEYLISEDSILIESDLIFEESIFERILNHPSSTLAAVAKYESWMDGTVVTLDENDDIVNLIPRKAFDYNDRHNYYKTVNIYKFSKDFSKNYYVPFLIAYCQSLGHNEYYEQVLRVITMIDKVKFKALLLNDEKWYEIDDIQDLDIAEAIFADENAKLDKYSSKFGGYWRFPKLLDFCYLVNPYFPCKKLKEELKASFDTLLESYPSGSNVNNLLAAKYFHLKPQYILVGNGAAELIKALMLSIKGKIGIIYPTFEEYPNRKLQNDIITFTPNNKDFSYNADDLISFFSTKNIRSLLLINPDNPSGNFIILKDIYKLLKWTKENSIQLIIDESFVDFSDESQQNSILHNEILDTYKNLVIVKSISKSYGVPGLRLGIIASSDLSLLNEIKKDLSIWNINSFAEYYMQIFNKYENEYFDACKKIINERIRFYEDLKKVSYLRVLPSQANYFLCEITDTYTSEKLASILLTNFNILIKDCGHKKSFDNKNFVRIAVRNKTDNQRLNEALLSL